MNTTLGLMSAKPGGRSRFLPYVEAASEAGFKRVILFAPEDVDLTRRKITGYAYQKHKWVRTVQRFPDLIYDIGHYRTTRSYQQAEEIKSFGRLPFVGDWLGNRWVVYQGLKASPEIAEHLVETKLLIRAADGISMLERHKSVMLKPVSSDSGTGINRITHRKDMLIIEENGGACRSIPIEAAGKYLDQLAAKGYLMQPALDWRINSRNPWNCRALIQKDGLGSWSFTGLFVQEGQTSRLRTHPEHGGQTVEAYPFLAKRFGEEETMRLHARVGDLTQRIAEQLELYYNRSFAELGVDLAIGEDRSLHILEVNHKPGKPFMRTERDLELYEKSIRMPFQYAAYLAHRQAAATTAAAAPPWTRDTSTCSRAELIEQIVQDGMAFYRTPYRFGAVPWSIDAFDCSSFMQFIFARNGLLLPRTSRQQSLLGYDVARKNLERGDLLFFSVHSRMHKRGLERIGHVGIYLGDGRFLHSCKAGGVVVTELSDPFWNRLYIKGRRVIEEDGCS
ncbi:YheC/YheD family protein [Paenibacillus sp. XY044]|uniref:YheC/YheD family protein n=1 Tax=Paenibacillus sp. XY044 TaxID=2026089 RepID=UPI0015C68501|nr:YheC/YheD family protein [Paenibacillus sp. XY044]